MRKPTLLQYANIINFKQIKCYRPLSIVVDAYEFG